MLGWRTCYVFLCDKLVDYSRLFTELQQLKDQAREAQEANEAQEAEAQEEEAKETGEVPEEAKESASVPIIGCIAKAGFPAPRPLLKTGSKPHLVALAVSVKMGVMTRANYLIDLFLDCIQCM